MTSLRRKALILIEHIACEDASENPAVTEIYKLSHAANDACLNRHEDWKKQVEDLYAGLITSGEYREESPGSHRRRLQKLSDKMEHITSLNYPRNPK